MEENVIHLNQMNIDVFIKPLTMRERANMLMKFNSGGIEEMRRMLVNNGALPFGDNASDDTVKALATKKLTARERDTAAASPMFGIMAHIMMTKAFDPATRKPLFASMEEAYNAPCVDADQIVMAVLELSGLKMDV
jgi:hypothetical protein